MYISPDIYRLSQREVSEAGQVELELVKVVVKSINNRPIFFCYYSRQFSGKVSGYFKRWKQKSFLSEDDESYRYGLRAEVVHLLYEQDSAVFVQFREKQA